MYIIHVMYVCMFRVNAWLDLMMARDAFDVLATKTCARRPAWDVVVHCYIANTLTRSLRG